MTNQHIANTIKELGLMLGANLEEALFEDLFINSKTYGLDEVFDFKRDLIESANKVRIVLLDQNLQAPGLSDFIRHVEIPMVAFTQVEGGFLPIILTKGPRGITRVHKVHENSIEESSLLYYMVIY